MSKRRTRLRTGAVAALATLLHLALLPPLSAQTAEELQGQADDVSALWELYLRAGGPNWAVAESYGWNETATNACGNWSGVTCDDNDRVIELDLSERPMLSGTLPTEIAELEMLQELHISNTSLSGTLPTTIGYMAEARELVLSHNRLSGTISWPSLDVHDDLPSLMRLLWNDNYISGTIPAVLGELTTLHELSFENNPLSGTVPVSFSNLTALNSCGLGEGMNLDCSEFQSMSGACNGYSCTAAPPAPPSPPSPPPNPPAPPSPPSNPPAPPSMPDNGSGDVAGLWELYLKTGGPNWAVAESYGWSETAPHACDDWSGVTCDDNERVLELDLSERPMLSGTLPFEIAYLQRLQELHISNTSLSGTLPESIGYLAEAREWVLSHNRLSGSINAPDEGVGEALPYLTTINLNDNYFSGTIPASLGELSNLEELNFENNPVSGTVPASFANLTSLWSCGLGEGMNLYCSEFQSMPGACNGYSCTPPPPGSPPAPHSPPAPPNTDEGG